MDDSTSSSSDRSERSDSSLPGSHSDDTVRPAEKSPKEGISLFQRVRVGAAWSVANVVLLRFGNVAVMAIIARLVAPDEFGVFALALTIYAFVTSLGELGVASAVARADLDPDRIAPTASTIAIVSSGAMAALMVIFADPLAAAVGSAEASEPLRVMAISVALTGPFAVPAAQLFRDFRQDRIFRASVISFVPAQVLLLVLASFGSGAMAFAWSRVLEQLVFGAVVVASVTRRYRPGFARSEIGPLLRFGMPLALANLLSQVLLNVDYVFVGRQLGTREVGLYLLAFNIASWPTAMIGAMLNSVVIPAFSRLKQDADVFTRSLVRAARTVGLVAFPIGLMTLALAEPLMETVYGIDWIGAAAPLSALSIFGILFAFGLLLANVIIALSRTGLLLLVQVVALVVLLPTMAIGIGRAGLVGVGVSHVLVIVSTTISLYILIIHRERGFPLREALLAAASPFAAGVLAAVLARAATFVSSTPLIQLLMGGATGVIVYGVLMAPRLSDLLPASLASYRPLAQFVSAHRQLTRRLRRYPDSSSS